jgi:hypothetical protein
VFVDSIFCYGKGASEKNRGYGHRQFEHIYSIYFNI